MVEFFSSLLELERAARLNIGQLPSYPVIKATTWPAPTVERLLRTAAALGHDGIILQGTDALGVQLAS